MSRPRVMESGGRLTVFRPHRDSQREQSTLRRFKAWAATYNVELQEIPTQTDRRTPDYKVIFPDAASTVVIVEVKEIGTPFVMNSEGVIIMQPESRRSDEMKSWGVPVRQKIKKAHPQLAPFASDGYPTLLVIGMWTPAIDRDLDFAIPFAMRGGQHGIQIQCGGVQFVLQGLESGGRQLADNVNTSISGIARVMGPPNASPWRLVVYRHNNPKVMLPDGLPGVDYWSA